MAAPEGNTNAEKWTLDATVQKLNEIEAEAQRSSVYYIGQALANVGLYHEWYSYITEKFKDNEIVFNTVKKINQSFEAKLVGKTLEGELNPTMAIFTLKNKHEWKDKSEQDVNHSGGVNNNAFNNLTYEQLYQLKYGKKPE